MVADTHNYYQLWLGGVKDSDLGNLTSSWAASDLSRRHMLPAHIWVFSLGKKKPQETNQQRKQANQQTKKQQKKPSKKPPQNQNKKYYL